MRENPDMGSIDHVGFHELQTHDIGVIAFELTHVCDPFELANNDWMASIAFCFLPAISLGEPVWGLGDENQSEEKKDCRDHLESPGSPEGSSRVDGTETDLTNAIRNIEHDHHTPGNGPLLSAYMFSMLGWWLPVH